MTGEGHFFHIDFGYVLGEDPKPFTRPVRLPREVMEAMKSTNRYEHFKALSGDAFVLLRRTARFWTTLLSLTANAGGTSVLAHDAVEGINTVRQKMRLELDENAARLEIIAELEESATSMVPVFYDKVHQSGLFVQ